MRIDYSDDEADDVGSGGWIFWGNLFAIGGIWVFEKFIGGAKSFEPLDWVSLILMCSVATIAILVYAESRQKKMEFAKQQEHEEDGQKDRKSEVSPKRDRDFVDGVHREGYIGGKKVETSVTSATEQIESGYSGSTREKLKELKVLLDDGLINEKDYENKKAELLKNL